jgi:hypothetical protein
VHRFLFGTSDSVGRLRRGLTLASDGDLRKAVAKLAVGGDRYKEAG